MFVRNCLLLAGFVLLGCLMALNPIAHAHPHTRETDALPTDTIRFDPPFVTVGKQGETITIALQVTDRSLVFRGDKLILEEEHSFPNGHSFFSPVAELRDDGKQGDLVAWDSVFTGKAKFREEVTGTIRLRAQGLEKARRQILVSPIFSLPAQLACGPTGNVMPVQIFEAKIRRPSFKTIEFNVPKAGKAILRLVNGARIGAPLHERFALAKVVLNGKRVHVLPKWSNVAEVPVDLINGTNRLKLSKGVAQIGERLSARIDACPDTLELKPVLDTQHVGDVLKAEAILTGLGVPVPNAHLSFTLTGLGNFPSQTSITGESGLARMTLPPFNQAGIGTLEVATVMGKPVLGDSVAINVITTPSIGVRQSVSTLRVTAGEEGIPVSFFVDLFKPDTLAYEASFEQSMEPNDGGITLTPHGPQTVRFEERLAGQETKPRIKEFPVAIAGVQPGHYTITSRVTFRSTGEKASTAMAVDVLPATDTLVLEAPTIQPGAIPISTATPVVFQTSASGVSTFPERLTVQECIPAPGACGSDPNDSTWRSIGDLLDNAQHPDAIAGDRVYSSELLVKGDHEGQLLYRIKGEAGASLATSTPTLLQVSRFPNGPSSVPSEIIKDPESGIQLVAEQVLVSFLPGVTPDRIEEIVDQVSRAVTGQGAEVIGQIPQIGLFQIKLAVDATWSESDRTRLVNVAIQRFNDYDEVRYAHINALGSPASTPDDGGGMQWGAPRIHADKAWDAVSVTPPGNNIHVAVIDTGVQAHPDIGNVIALNNGGNSDTSTYSLGHGTGVAAIIAAPHGNGGISGIAYGATIASYNSNNFTQLDSINGIITAADKAEIKVINLSWTNAASTALECALKYAAKLPSDDITAACSPQFGQSGVLTPSQRCSNNSSNFCGRGKLVVAAAGNNGTQQVNNTVFPCSYNDLVLCVGNSTVNPPSAVSSYPHAAATDTRHAASQSWPNQPQNGCGAMNYSNYGPDIDIYAPGTCIYTASKNGGYDRRTGTSFSAPHVTGAAAVAWAEMGITQITAQTVKNQLLQCSKPVQVDGKPLLDMFKAVSPKMHANLVSGEADFWNLFGVYFKDPTNPSAEPKARIIHNIHTLGGGQQTPFVNLNQVLYLTRAEKDHIEYFLIPNGARLNPGWENTISDVSPYVEANLTVGPDPANPSVHCVKSNGGCLVGQGAPAYFSEPTRNPDGQVHVRDQNGLPFQGARDGQQRWEDLPISNPQSGDFNDAVIQVNFDLSCP